MLNTSNGRKLRSWCPRCAEYGYLGSIAIASGVVYTSYLPNLTGKWTAYVNGAACGSITVRDKQIWSLMKPLKVIKVRVGDRVELKFDTWEHAVHVAKVNDEPQ